MSDGSIDLGEPTRLLRLDTLVRLRWLSVLGQVTAIVVVSWVLWYPMPSFAALGVVGLSALLNLAIRASPPSTPRLSDRDAFLMLAWDVLQLAALLYLTGGLQNPFSILFMAPVLISATALPPSLTLALGGLAAACATVLTVVHAPLPWREGEPLELPLLYVGGVWVAVLLGLGFTGVYAWRVAQEARDLSQGPHRDRCSCSPASSTSPSSTASPRRPLTNSARPLATIALVAEELSRATPKDAPTAEDVALLRSEVDRCRHILGKLTTLQDEDEGPLGVLSLGHLLDEVASPHRAFETKVKVRLGGKGPEPALRRNPGLLYGLGNLVENAVDFAQDEVTIDAAWDDDTVRVRVRDDGPGFPPRDPRPGRRTLRHYPRAARAAPRASPPTASASGCSSRRPSSSGRARGWSPPTAPRRTGARSSP